MINLDALMDLGDAAHYLSQAATCLRINKLYDDAKELESLADKVLEKYQYLRDKHGRF